MRTSRRHVDTCGQPDAAADSAGHGGDVRHSCRQMVMTHRGLRLGTDRASVGTTSRNCRRRCSSAGLAVLRPTGRCQAGRLQLPPAGSRSAVHLAALSLLRPGPVAGWRMACRADRGRRCLPDWRRARRRESCGVSGSRREGMFFRVAYIVLEGPTGTSDAGLEDAAC